MSDLITPERAANLLAGQSSGGDWMPDVDGNIWNGAYLGCDPAPLLEAAARAEEVLR